jgi:hypothetical protein
MFEVLVAFGWVHEMASMFNAPALIIDMEKQQSAFLLQTKAKS